MRPHCRAKVVAAVLLCGVSAAQACGKKGPPLAPLVHVPAAVEQVSARRIGDDVYVTLSVPSQNIDASTPADVSRVEVYGATAFAPPPRSRFLEIAELLEVVPVTPPDTDGAGSPPSAGGAVQGSAIIVRDPLTPEDLIARTLAEPAPARRAVLPVAETRGALRRFYLGLAFSDRGRPGPPGAIAELLLTPLPEPPAAVEIDYTHDAVSLTWQPSGGLIGFLMNQALPPELPPFDEIPTAAVAAPGAGIAPGPGPRPSDSGARPLGPTMYNIYRELAADPTSRPEPTGPVEHPSPAPPAPLNPAPLDALTFTDELEFERERCYVIRAVRGAGSELVEGHGSDRQCVTPVDVFPPAPPTGLTAVGAEGSISLIWEASADGDVAGYLVLRGGTADATLLPITPTPVTDTQFVDRDVTPGGRYAYAVVAVDDRVPLPNVSPESGRVEETAR